MLTKSHWFAVMAFGLLAIPLSAQGRITLSAEVLRAGTIVPITYTNPNRAGTPVVIDIDNGMRHNTVRQKLTVYLDENGVGVGYWEVPEWFGVNFNAPDAPENGAPILPPENGDGSGDGGDQGGGADG